MHGRPSLRRRYYILRQNVVEKVLKLLRRRERWLAAAAVRFLRTCLGMKVGSQGSGLLRANSCWCKCAAARRLPCHWSCAFFGP